MSELNGAVICAGARTPIGRFGGALAGLSAMELGGVAIAAALERARVAPEAVEHVVMGQVLQAGQGQITARQAAVRAGIPMTVPALTVNKVCLSGTNAIATAAHYVALGQAGLLVAGGMESMSTAPYLLPKGRFGVRMGHAELVDSMIHDGLWDAFDQVHMGVLSDQVNTRLGIGRAEQDEWAARSHERAATAAKGVLREEITPVQVPQRKGDPILVEEDEGVRPGTTTPPPWWSPPASGLSARACRCSPSCSPMAPSPGPTRACTRSRRTPSATPASVAAWPWRTWSWWRSTRPSPPWCCSRSVSLAWTRPS